LCEERRVEWWRHLPAHNRSVRRAIRLYLVEQLTADGVIYYKSCFRCNHCKGTLKVSLSFQYLFPFSSSSASVAICCVNLYEQR
jgi:hypothetical protein